MNSAWQVPTTDDPAQRAWTHCSDLCAWEQRLATPMLVAAVLVIPAIVLEAGDYGSGWSTVGQVLNWATWLAFASELVIMLVVVYDRHRWMRAHPVEVVVTLFSPPVLPGWWCPWWRCRVPRSRDSAASLAVGRRVVGDVDDHHRRLWRPNARNDCGSNHRHRGDGRGGRFRRAADRINRTAVRGTRGVGRAGAPCHSSSLPPRSILLTVDGCAGPRSAPASSDSRQAARAPAGFCRRLVGATDLSQGGHERCAHGGPAPGRRGSATCPEAPISLPSSGRMVRGCGQGLEPRLTDPAKARRNSQERLGNPHG
jgi:hypothetical protein